MDNVIKRITEMERCLDEISEAFYSRGAEIKNDDHIQESIKKLTDYYESDLWLSDYEADSEGRIPRDLKRGVLSEDAVYNLLAEIEDMYDGELFEENESF